MDSLSQFSLGAAIGMAALGRKIGYRKAAVTGGVLGTLPDLDVFYPFDDPVDSFVLHRAATHSLIVHTLATPLIAEAARLLLKPLREARGLVYLTVFLCLTTHALLDAMTVYGTQIFWPLWREPLGLGSIFIIDPLYTLPLLAVVLWGLIVGGGQDGAPKAVRRPALRRGVFLALLVSTLYLGWTATAQQIVLSRAQTLLAAEGYRPERVLATPTPFNSLFWRVIGVEGGQYHNLYIPLFGGAEEVALYSHPRLTAQAGCVLEIPAAATVADFADGFFKLERIGDRHVIADLRMGVTPDYVFRFAVAEQGPGEPVTAIAPQRAEVKRSAGNGDIDWLLAGILGDAQPRASEAALVLAANSGPQGTTAAC